MISAHPIYDPRLSSRLRIALVAAAVLHIVLLLVIQFRAQEMSRYKPRPPLLIQVLPKVVTPKSISMSEPKQVVTEIEEVSVTSVGESVPVITGQSDSVMVKDSSAPEISFYPLAAEPVVANLPRIESLSLKQAMEAAQELARTALRQLSPTPEIGLEPTAFGKPVTSPVSMIPVPISSISQAQREGPKEEENAQGVTDDDIEALDLALAATSSSKIELRHVTENFGDFSSESVSDDRDRLVRVSWDEPGKGCTVIEDPIPDTAGIFSDGLTYHIEVQFWVGPTGLVSRSQISRGSGNSRLDAAVLDAARRMSFNCSAETRGRKSYLVRTVRQATRS